MSPSRLACQRLGWRANATLVAVLAGGEALAAAGADVRVLPGPTVISEDEKAIDSDPAAGAEHAVILIEETERDEDFGADIETRFHLRAKILSNEGRDLANVEIPLFARYGRLVKWWGRTLLPDGTVLELKEDALERQSLVKAGGIEVQALKAPLPGVVPGCVIDYGYTLREGLLESFRRVPLQRVWLVREFRYQWTPSRSFPSGYIVQRREGLDIQVTRDRKAVLVVARNLPPVPEEPWMPPDHEVRSAVTLYYAADNRSYKDYWELEAKRKDRAVRAFNANSQGIRRVIAEMKLDAAADPAAKVQAAYDWLAANVKHTGLLSAEEIDSEPEEDEGKAGRIGADQVLEARAGSGTHLDYLFIGLARALGAEANLAFATNRTQNFWEASLMSMNQFHTTLVVLQLPGDEIVLADPGSGLPFGDIPWWLTGTNGLLATAAGAKSIFLPPSQANHNVSDSRVELHFTADNTAMSAKWTQSSKGQIALLERRALRSLAPAERTERLEELCGSGPDSEVLSATSSALDGVSASFELSCETSRSDLHLDDSIGRYSFMFLGPWASASFDLPPGRRTHAVVFPFPRVDVVELDIVSPAGFAPSMEPFETKLEGPYGRYSLAVKRTETGYRVNRGLAILPLTVPASDYEALRRFFADIQNADQTPLEFLRQEAAE